MGISLYLVWKDGLKKKQVQLAVILFGVQLSLNAIWSILFFGLNWILIAFIEILLLLGFIIATKIQFWKINKTAAYLLIPYVLWVAFASVLNFSLWLLNKWDSGAYTQNTWTRRAWLRAGEKVCWPEKYYREKQSATKIIRSWIVSENNQRQ